MKASLEQPCDCGGQVRHNNGGNYHITHQARRTDGGLESRTLSTSEHVGTPDWVPTTIEAVRRLWDRECIADWKRSGDALLLAEIFAE